MLADVLDGEKERMVDALERRAAASEDPRLSAVDRRGRLQALVEELIEALRHGGANTGDRVLDRRERELVSSYVLEQIDRHRMVASTAETAMVGKWPCAADLRRLHEENRRLCTLLDGVAEGAAILSPDGRVQYVNRRASQVLHEATGVAPDAILGKTFAELGALEELGFGRAPEEILALARRGDSFEAEAWGRTKENRFEAVYAPDGTVTAVAFVSQDIHSRKLDQRKLALISKLSVLVGSLDYDEVAEALAQVPIPELADWCAVNIVEDRKVRGTFIACRDPSRIAVRDALMRTASGWDRHPLWQEMLTGGFQLLTEVSDDFLRELARNDDEYRLLSRLGIRSLMVVPVVSRGQVAGIMTFAYTAESGRRYGRDDPGLTEEYALYSAHIIEDARLMKELRASETRFRIALAGARTVVFEQDRSLRYTWYYNPMVSLSPVGKTHEEAFPADQAALLTEAKKRVLDEGESVFEEMDLRFMGDELRHFREAIEPLRDRNGKIVGVVGSATDITEQQRTQQQLTEALGFRERMMGILGHDLRNPLNTISLADGLLLRRKDLAPDARDLVQRVRSASDRMGEMISTLLDFTRARSLGGIPITPVPADLGEIARSAIDEARATWPDRQIALQVQGDAHGQFDPARMAQVISNLVGNAVAYGGPGTPIRVVVEGEDGDEVILEVANQGPPIPEDLLPVLFEPFHRGVSKDRSPQGLGLGLYIVKQIVLAHDGTIGVESTAKRGTTITVHLPRTHVSSTMHEPAPAHA